MPDSRRRRPLTAVGALATVGGLLLFVWWIRRIGLDDIRAGFAQIGWGLAGIVLLGGLRFALRAVGLDAVRRAAAPAARSRRVRRGRRRRRARQPPAARARSSASRPRPPSSGGALPLGAAVTALAIENVLYTLSVAAMIAAGMAALLFVFDIPLAAARDQRARDRRRGRGLRRRRSCCCGGGRRVVSRTSRPVLPGDAIGERDASSDARRSRSRSTPSRAGAARVMVPIVGAELVFHALGVLEVYITLWLLLGTPPAFLIAFIVETADRLMTVVFKFVPLQMGVSEAGTAFLTGMLGLGTTLGTTLGLVRKARMLCWTAVGTILLVRRGVSAASVLADQQLNNPTD